MNHVPQHLPWVVLALMVLALLAPAAEASEDGFVPIFDGKTLAGWTVDCLPKDRPFAAKAWTVENGALVADTMGHKDHFYILLATNKEYGDFVLRLKVQVERGTPGNSGIQIRSRYNAETGWMEGPQIDIDPPNPRGTTARLWNEGPGQHRWLSPQPAETPLLLYADQNGGWNDLEISAQGMRIKTVLNGVTVTDYNGSGVLDDEEHRKLHVGTIGVIGLQIHAHDELKLRFKDLRIKELANRDADKKTPPRPAAVDLRPELKEFGIEPKRQGDRPTCSVFATAWSLEYALSKKLGKATPLSVEYLNWASNQVTSDPTDGSFFHDALRGCQKHGICEDRYMPYLPRHDPKLLPTEPAKASAKAIGGIPLTVYWIRRWTPKPGLSERQMDEICQTLARGWPVAAGSEHSRLLVGYRDDPKQPGGGEFLTQDSALGGYGSITYAWAKENVGDAFWVEPQ